MLIIDEKKKYCLFLFIYFTNCLWLTNQHKMPQVITQKRKVIILKDIISCGSLPTAITNCQRNCSHCFTAYWTGWKQQDQINLTVSNVYFHLLVIHRLLLLTRSILLCWLFATFSDCANSSALIGKLGCRRRGPPFTLLKPISIC